MEMIQPDPGSTNRHFTGTSSFELDRFLEFVGKLERETGDCLGIEPTARELQIMVQLMRSHSQGRLETASSLIAVSGLSHGTAYRTIERMIEEGLITKRPRTRTGKSFSLHPSSQLIERWLEYIRRMKSLFGSAFGLSKDADYFFGGSYLSASIIPPLPVRDAKLKLPGGLRILLHADPSFMAMQKLKQQFEMLFGVDIVARALSIDRLHQEIIENGSRTHSHFDIITCDICWMAELIEKSIVQPVDNLGSSTSPDLGDFHPEALSTVLRGRVLHGIPVQTTPELLIYRKDLLARIGLVPPTTLDDLVSAARSLHDPSRGISGIAWNGARGTPVGTTFMMLMADLGQPVLYLPKAGAGFTDRDISPAHYRPALDTVAALEAAEILLELMDWSPPNVLQMSWFERARCYAKGEAAMAYCYTQIMPMFESDPTSPAHRNTGFCPHPSGHGRPQIAPLGGWHLCVPSNLRKDRFEHTLQAVRTLTSAAATKLYIENGSLVSSQFSVCNDPDVAHNRPIIPIVDQMARKGQLQAWPRPAVAELNDVVRILGDEIHIMLLRNKKPPAAIRDAQARCDRLMRENGRY